VWDISEWSLLRLNEDLEMGGNNVCAICGWSIEVTHEKSVLVILDSGLTHQLYIAHNDRTGEQVLGNLLIISTC